MATETLTETTEVELTAEEAAQEAELLNAIDENIKTRPHVRNWAISMGVFFITSLFINSYSFGGFFGFAGIGISEALRTISYALAVITIVQGIRWAGSFANFNKMMKIMNTLQKGGLTVGRK